MKLISYTAKQNEAAANRAKIEAVFAALGDAAPADLAYMVVETVTGEFFHIVEGSPAAFETLQAMPAFKAFSSTVGERQMAPSMRREARIIGSYGDLAGK